VTLLEPDVALTDFGLTIECLALAAWLRLQSLIAAGHRGTIPTQGPSRQRSSGGKSDGRHVVTKRAGHRPGLPV